VAAPEQWAEFKRVGWRFHIPVFLGIGGGAFLILAVELLRSAHLIPSALRDAGLVVGGMLLGLIAISLYELYWLEPERARIDQQREAERQRHQEERRLDFEQYRAMQSDLREIRSHAATLQAKLDLTGALDRDRVGDALLLGFYFHRRRERLPSGPHQPVFKTAATRLKLVSEENSEIKLDKGALRGVLFMTYGPIVAEAFDLGYLLSHLDEEGFPETRPEILSELERQLNALKLDSKPQDGARVSDEVSELFKKLAARVISIVRRA
jgi:hypothetical protein